MGLVNLIGRNRLALVVLAASLTAGARSRAEAYADSAAVRWLARNARSVRHFLASLSLLRRCAGQAGYRALDRAAVSRRRATAPQRVTACGAPAPVTGLLLSGREGRRVVVPPRL